MQHKLLIKGLEKKISNPISEATYLKYKLFGAFNG